jgi:hypothetical protein
MDHITHFKKILLDEDGVYFIMKMAASDQVMNMTSHQINYITLGLLTS